MTTSVVSFSTDAGVHEVSAEVVSTPDARATGLMHREALGMNEGMLFVFPDRRQQTFWMKNTLIPLDMIFLDADGASSWVVSGIVHGAKPGDLTPRTDGGPSRLVLEVVGGWAAARGLQAGTPAKIQDVDTLLKQSR